MSVNEVKMMTRCQKCGGEAKVLWKKIICGPLPDDYMLVAELAFHPGCWDKMVERNPP